MTLLLAKSALGLLCAAALLLGPATARAQMNPNGSLVAAARSPGPPHVNATPQYTTFGWHHVVPWTLMRDSWRYLQANGKWDVLKEYMTLIGVEDPAAEVALMQGAGTPNNGVIHSKLSYPAFNLVEGPEARNDNPLANVRDVFVNGMSNSEKARQTDLGNLDTAMRPFLYAGAWPGVMPVVTAKQVTALKTLLNKLNKSYRASPAVQFKEAMWEVVTAGKAARAVAGAGPRATVWKKCSKAGTKQKPGCTP